MAKLVSLTSTQRSTRPWYRPVLSAMFPGLLVFVLGLALIQSSFSQTFGEITGVVTDTSGRCSGRHRDGHEYSN